MKFKSKISEQEFLKIVEERKPLFAKIPALLQKYFTKDRTTGEYAGIYLWENEDAMIEYQQSDLAKSTTTAYMVEGKPKSEEFRIQTQLRN